MTPTLFTIGSFNVYAFGFFLVLAFILSTFIIWKNGKEDLKEEEYLDAFLYTSMAVLLCARLTYILLNFDEFGFNFLKYIVVMETPGLSLLGGLFGGFLFIFWYSQKYKMDFLKLTDLFSVAGCFSLVLAKIGLQLAGAGFGREITPGRRHPVELYEAVMLSILSLLLVFIYSKVKRNKYPSGLPALVLGTGLSLIIFLLEFLKVYPVYLYSLSFRQVTAIIIFLALTIPLIKKLKIIRKKTL